MDLGPSFRKFRAVSFTCIAVVALAWTALTCVVLYMHWGDADRTQSSLIVVLLCVNVVTVILIPALILVEFRVWLDAARMAFLLLAHFCAAVGFTLWATKYQCPTTDDGICSLMNIYVLLASWVNPLLILTYSTCLAVGARRRYNVSFPSPSTEEKYDIEQPLPTPTTAGLPIMEVPRSQRGSLASTVHKHMSARMSRQPWLTALPPLSAPPLPLAEPGMESPSSKDDASSSKRKSTRSSARLSKPLPSKFF
ncbi:hypothetical protein PHLGIDRAFT_19020 [Phlebiopsis gigantea 11061_1 CR5-6]|uniref:Uncharacterized protein n=1 Tax=Phlebiopsis gigantea (strain 11061_1 CR5-6) TaxID=745531 RepID=A0A0C3PN45_PHLG1|nr:hypothetical protein PHLGIDRAFT_19020 [Phlebiopsis gigantea 11061_1 CR5-6]